MTTKKKQNKAIKSLSESELSDLVLENDSGARRPDSKLQTNILVGTALLWSLFQLWIASPLPFWLVPLLNNNLGMSFSVLNDTETRSIHLGFAILLAYLAYPALKKSPRNYIPFMDWIMAIGGTFCACYLYLFYEDIANRSGMPTDFDKYVAAVGMLLLLEATRRSLGPPLLIIASIFLIYTFAGSHDMVPDLIRHKGQSLGKVSSHQWLTTEGVFGIALGVSTSFVFLFVLFGSLLDKAGAGNYFIKVAFSLLGHLRGGPAKAAVLASGMTGLISGSSIANTVTTGTFTIPLMKRVGFSGEKAAAVEVSSSVNGQIMPPVMGAAAFLMVEYVGIPYTEVIKHAFLPALISYIALLYIVHLEAVKSNMEPLPKANTRKLPQSLVVYGITISSIIIFSYIVYYIVGFLKTMFAEDASLVLSLLILVSYIGLIWYSCKSPELEKDDPNAPVVKLPETGPTVKAGLHYLLPIVVLVWCLMIERFSPGLSAFWATVLMIFIVVTQPLLKSFFRGENNVIPAMKEGICTLLDGLITGSRNMIGIGVATAAAGIIVGTVSLTGVGQVLTEVVEVIAGDSLLILLVLTAVICLILGMGLPTTANYIVVASLMAQVVQQLGEQNGLIVPLIAIHMFVFYFGIMADVTPPVGLASFAAAAISGSDPIKTGLQAFAYSIRTAMLPFFFIFNTEMLMVGVDSIAHGAWVFFYSTVAILLFSAAFQGYFLVRNKMWETVVLLSISVTLFVPQLLVDFISPPYKSLQTSELMGALQEMPEGALLKVEFEGESIDGGTSKVRTFIPAQGSGASSEKILEDFGLALEVKGDSFIVADVGFNSTAENAGIDFDYVLKTAEIPQEQFNSRMMYIPAMILFIIVFASQTYRRKTKMALASAAA